MSMNCVYHPALEAIATCSSCGKAICSNCVVDTGERVICRTCMTPRSSSAGTYGPGNNQMALWSMILGLGGWLLSCLNFFGGVLLGVLTLGLGLICATPVGLLSFVAWIVGVIMGHGGLNALNRPGNQEEGRGMAIAGLVASYGGLGVSLLLCALVVLVTMGIMSIPLIDGMMNY